MIDSNGLKMDSALRRVLRNSSWLLAAQVVAGVMMFTQIVVMTHSLGVVSYGTFALLTTFVMSVIQICDCRVWEALITYVPRYRSLGNLDKSIAMVQLCLMVELVSGTVAWFAIVALADFSSTILLQDETVADSIRLLAVLAIVKFPHEPITALLRIENRFHWQGYYRSSLACLRMLTTAIACFVSPSIDSILIAEIVSHFIGSLILLTMGSTAVPALKLSCWSFSRLKCLRDDLREIASFMFYSSVAGNTRMVTTKADILLLGLFASPAAIAVYDLAKKVTEGLLSLSNPFYMSVFPEISAQVAAESFSKTRKLQREITKLVIGSVIPFCILATILVPIIIPPVFGSEFRNAAPLLQIMVWQLLAICMVWFPGYLLALGMARTQTLLVVCDAMIYFFLLAVLTPVLGGFGAAIATTGRVVTWMMMAYFVLSGLGHVRPIDSSSHCEMPLTMARELNK
ncbi:Inner membrane protein YghQ [Rosistilla carotiformis]|uniref:Inner membrane protein YghQ n=1 Tax=Rosistilla carotiformis TaxID=2528017 RepID=A0A518K0U7_9BACT|nr:oligosaccharide flippase family protein [Rosistilla carotiformis]QDV71424.1 Inner membrane protein YghQ [Rosistilla carotiformis]